MLVWVWRLEYCNITSGLANGESDRSNLVLETHVILGHFGQNQSPLLRTIPFSRCFERHRKKEERAD
jgi:hypothetical protein